MEKLVIGEKILIKISIRLFEVGLSESKILNGKNSDRRENYSPIKNINWGASSRWSFHPNYHIQIILSAHARITIGNKRPTLEENTSIIHSPLADNYKTHMLCSIRFLSIKQLFW